MHPNKFFSEVNCRTGIDVFEIFDGELKEQLKNIHPLNFIKTKVTLPVYKVFIEYDTVKGNHKSVERYMVMDNPVDSETYEDFEADMLVRDYNDAHPDNPMVNPNIMNILHICDTVLPIFMRRIHIDIRN